MKKNIVMNIDLTKSEQEVWGQISAVSNTITKESKPSLWKRIKSWF